MHCKQYNNDSVFLIILQAFTEHETVIMEYMVDLDSYYKYSYGSRLSSVLPCRLIKSMLETTSTTSPNKVTATFGHSQLMTLLSTALGIKRDRIPLLASNFEQQLNRQFKVGNIAPYAANFAAVKYNCLLSRSGTSFSSVSQSSSGAYNAETKVLMLLNQEPIEMPWCVGGAICTIDEMWQMFRRSEMRDCPYGICGDSFAKPKIFERADSC